MAINMEIDELLCYSDSLISANLIFVNTSQFHIYVVLIQDIKDLLATINFSIHHTIREGKQCADFMAKLGASTNVEFTVHTSPPHDLLPLLRADATRPPFMRI